jgi:hypothetical protein
VGNITAAAEAFRQGIVKQDERSISAQDEMDGHTYKERRLDITKGSIYARLGLLYFDVYQRNLLELNGSSISPSCGLQDGEITSSPMSGCGDNAKSIDLLPARVTQLCSSSEICLQKAHEYYKNSERCGYDGADSRSFFAYHAYNQGDKSEDLIDHLDAPVPISALKEKKEPNGIDKSMHTSASCDDTSCRVPAPRDDQGPGLGTSLGRNRWVVRNDAHQHPR